MRDTVLMLNMSETSRDPRVRRISSSLTRAGYRVVALNPAFPIAEPRSEMDGFEIRRFRGPRDDSHRAFAKVQGVANEVFAAIEPIDRAIFAGTRGLRRRLRARVTRQGRGVIRVAERLGRRALPEARKLLSSLEDENELERRRIRAVLLANQAMFEAGKDIKASVIHANDLNALVAGWMLKKHHGARLVYDAHELYPEQFPVNERSEIWHSFYTKLERLLLPHTDARFTVCDSVGDYFVEFYGAQPFITVRNVPSLKHLPDASILERKNVPRTFLYHGMFFKNRGLESLIGAGKYLRDGRIVLRGLGYHEDELRRLAADPSVRNRVTIEPPVPVDDLVRAASASDVGINPFPSACLNTEFALPNKFFEYAMAGLAIASSDLIELRRMTRLLGNGALFGSIDAETIAETLQGMIADPAQLDAQRARSYFAAKNELHWEKEELRLLEAYPRA